MPTPPISPRASNIRDNHTRGNVGDFLRERIEPESLLSFVTAYFTIYGYAALRAELEQIERLRLLFGEPRFIREVDPDKSAGKQFLIDSSGLRIANQLSQRAIARECADWIRRKVDIRSVAQADCKSLGPIRVQRLEEQQPCFVTISLPSSHCARNESASTWLILRNSTTILKRR